MQQVDFDVGIVGAGLSGIGAACHLQEKCPERSFAILEARRVSGGTWDLFRYPGVRSDSDMYTLGYRFKPWREQKAIADGPAILKYIRETAREHGLEEKVRYGHKVVHARWDSAAAQWQLDVEHDGKTESLRCNFLHLCSGYYRYDAGYTPDFEGVSDFQGRIVHPQHWPDALDYSGKRVVVIGSGATAVTLVPAMTEKAAHVTMLQRSPTYIVSRPAEDKLALRLRKLLPEKLAYRLTRWRNVLTQLFYFRLARKRPKRVKSRIIQMASEALGPEYDVKTHFTPNYDPWDQRLCLVPDGDLFAAIRSGQASIVTDEIERFTETGLLLKSGETLLADMIVTATGLDLQFAGGITLEVDGKRIKPHEHISYKGCMLSDVPNLMTVFGYTNASWTLRADLISEFLCRLLSYMQRENYVEARPRGTGVEAAEDFLEFSSGYVRRAVTRFPRRGRNKPWVLDQNYASDILLMRYGAIQDESLMFRRKGAPGSRKKVEI